MDEKFARSEEAEKNLIHGETIDTDLAATQKIGPEEKAEGLRDQTTTRTLERRHSVHSESKPNDVVDPRSDVEDNSKLPPRQNLIPEKVDEGLENPVDPRSDVEDNSKLPPMKNLIPEKVDEGLKNPVDPRSDVEDNFKLTPRQNLIPEK